MQPTQAATDPALTNLHTQFLAILPTIEQYARHAHQLANYHDREDAIAEAVAEAWARFRFGGRENTVPIIAHRPIPPNYLRHLYPGLAQEPYANFPLVPG